MRVTRRQFLKTSAAFATAGCVGVKPGESPLVRFGFVTDCHYAAHIVPRPGDLRMYPESLVKMREFVRDMNREQVDFVVEGGDFKDLGRSREESLKYLDEIESVFAGFEGPRYHVLGNHDHDNLTKEEFLSHVANEGQTEAKAYYAFSCAGIKFIVLDACYSPDGKPYCRGKFSWKKAFVPPEQIEFLRWELASAEGWCVPIVHQQLDAEDETCIVNAAEIRRVLEESGKVRCVVQGHFHEGNFHDLNGIGYLAAKANVHGHAKDENNYSIVEVYPSGGVRILGHASALSVETLPCRGWTESTRWRRGHYQIHHIFTGRGESMFHIFPDGTSMLLDVGDSMRFYGTPAETPHLPDLTRRAGEWVARYVERVNPKGAHVDYFHLSHYHEDHGGGERYHGERIQAPTGDYWRCGLGDAAQFLKFDRVVDRAWPGFDDPLDVLKTSRDGTPRNVKAVYAHLASKGTEIERFRLGARDQFRQLNAASACPGFEVFNLCSCGRYVRKDGSERDLYEHLVRAGAKSLNENGMSCGMIVSYGKFRFFTAGDFSDGRPDMDGTRQQIEDELAEAVGRVDVAKLNHHGHHSMFPKLVAALRARVWTACVLDRKHCTDDTMSRLADDNIYRGSRTFIPTFMPLERPETEFGRAYLPLVAQAVVREPCHVIVDVPPGGETYTVSCVSAATETPVLMAQYGFLSVGYA